MNPIAYAPKFEEISIPLRNWILNAKITCKQHGPKHYPDFGFIYVKHGNTIYIEFTKDYDIYKLGDKILLHIDQLNEYIMNNYGINFFLKE